MPQNGSYMVSPIWGLTKRTIVFTMWRGVKYSPKSFLVAVEAFKKYSKASPFTSLSTSVSVSGSSLSIISFKILASRICKGVNISVLYNEFSFS